MKRLLIAIDGSKHSLKAVDYVAEQFSGVPHLAITLFYVSPGVPPELWDDGHILTDEEKAERKAVLDKWLNNQRLKLEPVFQPAVEKLMKRDFLKEHIETKFASDSVENVPGCILSEARDGGYQTLVMGRCGAAAAAHSLLGSTVARVLEHSTGIAVCVVA
jgi:nucleotide-binding universal stress UspA family protein